MRSPRRYYLLKRFAARRQRAEEGVWLSKQQALPGTSLPSDFPSRSALISVGYETVEDVDGATCSELRQNARLSSSAAEAVIAAIAAL